jgi:spore coat polysaccharide biosynthesis protein SpsF (cytidylyltransferase family)
MSATETGRFAVFLSVRDKATRLPGKVMREIVGRRAIEHLIDRIKTAKRPDLVVMTTSVNPGDGGLQAVAEANGIRCFRGSEDDKLLRYLDAAYAHGVEFCCVVDGDDLFNDPQVIDRIMASYEEEPADYIIVDDLPVGVTSFGVRIDALREVVRLKDESDTEVWGGYFTQTGLFKTRLLDPNDEALRRPDLRMTLDYQEDLDFFTAIFEALYKPGEVFSLREIIELLEQRPDIVALNREVVGRYEQGLRKAAPVRLRDQAD